MGLSFSGWLKSSRGLKSCVLLGKVYFFDRHTASRDPYRVRGSMGAWM